MPKKSKQVVEKNTPQPLEEVKPQLKRIKKVKVPKNSPDHTQGVGTVKSPVKSKSKSKSPVKKDKVKRAPSKFALYMKENYEKVKHLNNKERLSALAKMYKNENGENKPVESGIVVNAKKD